MKTNRTVTLLFFYGLLFFSSFSQAQDTLVTERKNFVESGLMLSSSSQTPFWLKSNVLGVVPNTGQNLMFQAGFYQQYTKKNNVLKKYTWGYGLRPVVNVNQEKIDFLLPEAYLKAKIGIFEFWGGRRQEVIGLSDSSGLGTGPITWSSNALPMPKVQFGTPNFVNIAFKGLFAVKVSYAHGWFDNEGVVKNYFLHQKTFYARIGRPKAKFKFYGGLTHNVQWSGEQTLPDGTKDIYYHDFPAYLSVVIPVKYKPWLDGVDLSQYSHIDTEYQFGNHSGSFDLGFEITGKKRRAFIYKQSPYEYLATNSGVTEGEDGLYGIKITNFKNEKVKEFVAEMIYTMNQSRYVSGFYKLIGLPIERWEGDDSYFNHGQFTDGFVYKGKTISTPFILPRKDYKGKLPTDYDQLALLSNLVAFHVGMRGTLTPRHIQYQLKMSYANHYIKDLKTPSRQFSLGVNTLTPIKLFNGSQLVTNLGFDTGDVYENVFGLSFGIRKSW
jgi:Capsule assembly protein Wzi